MSKINLRTESAVFKNPTFNVPKQTLDELVPIDSRFVILRNWSRTAKRSKVVKGNIAF